MTRPLFAASEMFELDEEVRWILGRPCFTLIQYAEALRQRGFAIARKAEDEQACVIHWMLSMYYKYGKEWEKPAKIFLTEKQP